MRWRILQFAWLAAAVALAAQAPAKPLTIPAGARLELRLPQRTRLHGVGQAITAVLAAPVYADNQLALPAGTPVSGVVAAIHGAHWLQRLQAGLGGDFSPQPKVAIRFTSIAAGAGPLAITAAPAPDTPPLHLVSAGGPKPTLAAKWEHRVGHDLNQSANNLKSLARRQTHWDTLKYEAMESLPYHPTWLAAGTEYAVRLRAPLQVDSRAPAPVAVPPLPKQLPAGLILYARLVTGLSSQTARWGTPVEARLTRPALGANGHVVIPQGARLEGHITEVHPARRFGRSGQLRFTFTRLALPAGVQRRVITRLRAAASSRAVALNGEGGVKAAKPGGKTATLALGVAAFTAVTGDSDNAWSLNAGSGTHFRLWGAAMAALVARARPLALGLGFVGAGRTIYRRWIGRGPAVVFPAGTRIVIQITAPAQRGKPLPLPR